MNFGQGNVWGFGSSGSGGGGGSVAAANGLSVDSEGRVVLGNDVGGDLAAFLSNREIDFDNFFLAFNNAKLNITGGSEGEEVTVNGGANSTRMFLLDSLSGQYGLGNIDNGLRLAINDDGYLDIADLAGEFFGVDTVLSAPDRTAWLGDRNAGSYSYIFEDGASWAFLSMNVNNSSVVVGDSYAHIGMPGVSAGATFDGIEDTILFQVSNGPAQAAFWDFPNGLIEIGFDGGFTHEIMQAFDYNEGVFRVAMNASNRLELDVVSQLYRMGDINAEDGGLRIEIDDVSGVMNLINSASDAAYAINGHAGVSGDFMSQDGKQVFVEGGIITGIISE